MNATAKVSTINIEAVLVADIMGVLLLICVVVGNLFANKKQGNRNKYLFRLIIITICSCVLDAVGTLVDGKNRFAVYLCDTLSFLCFPMMGMLWILLVSRHIKVKLSNIHFAIICSFCLIAVGLIVANLFTPILFTINEFNVYERVNPFYLIYSTCYFGLLADVVILYIMKKHDSGGIKFFPMWSFIVPIAFGLIIQNSLFGVSTIAPFMTISITSVVFSFQKELLFRDQLTDLYNRYYLSVLEKRIIKNQGKNYSVIMLDINSFKSINDIYGHDMGDDALIQLSKILVSVVDKLGEVIRYAGDEFIIVLNSHDDEVTEKIISKINKRLEEFSKSRTAPYDLSVAMGWCNIDFEKTPNEIINEADKRMYNNKQEFYKNNPNLNGNGE